LNFRYFGPVDGHDVKRLTNVLRDLKDIPGPKILHCLTKKGKGYNPAEEGCATKWHAPGLFEKDTGKIIKSGNKNLSTKKYQEVFGETIIELAKENERIVGVTPAMLSGSSLNIMMEQMPERTFDVGIAEQHAVTFSAGMATQGMIPFCNIYSSFIQRAYDQVIHDVALQNLNVIFCLDRGGLVGADGATHHGAFDIAFLRCVPNMVVASPINEQELRNMMYTAQLPNQGPFSIRYPRGYGVMKNWESPFNELTIGEGKIINDGDEIAILSLGHTGNFVIEAKNDFIQMGLSIAHYDMRFAKPLDENLLHKTFKKFDKIITIEDGCLQGGFGSAILEFMADNSYKAEIIRLGIPDEFINHGTQEELRNECGFDKKSIVSAVKKLTVSKKVPQAI
jgi:1-deoxy-D-xylulose-5-phosphate synthase